MTNSDTSSDTSSDGSAKSAPHATVIQPAGWRQPSGYANGISARGRIIFVAGQIGWNPLTCVFESDDFVDQVAQALANIVTVLHSAGAGPEHLTRLTWYVTNRSEYLNCRKEIGAVYRELIGRNFPAMSVVVVHALIEEAARVEIEATAVIQDDGV